MTKYIVEWDSGSNTQKLIATGADGDVLTLASGDPTWAAGGSGSQTPWTADVDGAGYNLSNVGAIKDNAATPLLSADVNTRALYAADGSFIATWYDSTRGLLGGPDGQGNWYYWINFNTATMGDPAGTHLDWANRCLANGWYTTGSFLVDEAAPQDNSVVFEVNGIGGFADGVTSTYFNHSGFAINASGIASITSDGAFDCSQSVDPLPYKTAIIGNTSGTYWAGNGFAFSNTDTGTEIHGLIVNSDTMWFGSPSDTTNSQLNAYLIASRDFSYQDYATGVVGVGRLTINGTTINTITDDGTSVLQAAGNVSLLGLQSGSGPPATINTTGQLYVDTVTGLLYVQ